MSAFEYGVNVANKFGSLSDDEIDDPAEMLRRAEALGKKEEKTASQKKADKHAAAKKKKESAQAAALSAAAREADAKKAAAAALLHRRGDPANKENRPDGERGRGRGRGRGMGRGGRGGAPPRDGADREQGGENIGDRFGERGGRGGGRGRGMPRGGGRPFRGGRGGGMSRPMEEDHEHPVDETTNPLVNGDQNTEVVGGGYRGGFRGGRGGFRGESERPFRGGRGGRGRQFDRMSGSDRTGVKAGDKREGHGKGNWGTDQDELTGETENLNAPAQPEGDKPEEPAAPPREKTEEELRLEAEAEELAKQLTLDEFNAQKAARVEPQFNIRKAGEGANEKQFGKLVPLPKELLQDQPEEEIVVVRREPRTKRLDIEINFTDEQRGGRGRGGPRGGRGLRGGGRGEGRGPRQGNMAFEVNAEAFPALGAQ